MDSEPEGGGKRSPRGSTLMPTDVVDGVQQAISRQSIQAWQSQVGPAAGVGALRLPSKRSSGATLSPRTSEYSAQDKLTVSWSRPSMQYYQEGNQNLAKEPNMAVYQTLSYVFIALLVYAALLFIFKLNYFLPYDSGFALVALWGASMLGGQGAKFLGLPQLLGMLVSGIILKNCGDIVRGFEADWGAAIRAFGLMNILMRGGLEMDIGAVRRVGLAVVRLTVLPGVTEALVTALMAVAFFGMPFFLALSMGFILAAVSPAVVVGGMFDLQSRGFGVDKGIPSLVVAAASFDDVVAISGFSMCIGLAIGDGSHLVMDTLHGPINIFAGTSAGLVGGLILSCTKIWDNHYKRSAVLLLLGMAFTFAANLAHFGGAGALASLVMAATAAQLWAKGHGGGLSTGPDSMAAHEVEEDLCRIWRILAEPLLFSVIGSALDFSRLEGGTIPKAVAIIFGGVLFRVLAAYFATFGAGLNFKERFFIALAWMPKATVQAALGSVPLDMVLDKLKREDDPEKYDRFVGYGTDILTTAVFSILLTAPVGLIVIQQLGPRWLAEGVQKFEDDDNTNVFFSDVEERPPRPSHCSSADGAAVGIDGGPVIVVTTVKGLGGGRAAATTAGADPEAGNLRSSTDSIPEHRLTR